VSLRSIGDTRLILSSRPLHGVPVLLKDNIVTLDSMQSTSGSFALIDSRPKEEAALVTALRQAGAIILGKANLAEWAGLRTTDGTSGWSPRGGQATGVFYPNMKASGSSTGSAISTSLGLAFASFGTEVSTLIPIINFQSSSSLNHDADHIEYRESSRKECRDWV